MDFNWLNNFSSELIRGAWITFQLLLISGALGFLMAVGVALV